MIIVKTIGRMITISENGGEALEYSPAFVVSTTAEGIIKITNTGDGTFFQAAFTQWEINGKAYPQLPDRLNVSLALDKVVRRWTAL